VKENKFHPIIRRIVDSRSKLTPKAKLLADYIINNPRKVVFMTTKELAEACHVSEATVVRFVSQLGFNGYGNFLQQLRDVLDTELTLLDRLDLTDMKSPGAERFRRIVFEEIDSLKQLFESLDQETVGRVVDYLNRDKSIYVIGSRLSYSLSYYLGWSLTKIRPNIQILKGSDGTTIDWLTIAPENSIVVIVATTRYPNELIRIGKSAVRQKHTLIVLTDSSTCPLIQFAHETLIAPSRHIPFIGSLTTLFCLINYIVQELASRRGDVLKRHQEKLEQTYWENDILFNMKIGN
jgi:DNA-binding MurR/RpiR family transcriptional regulator